MEREELLAKHQGSIKYLLKVYNAKGDLYKGKYLIVSFLMSLLFSVIIVISNGSQYLLIVEVMTLTLSIIPNLLGFSLGAYALLIGLASSNLMEKLSSTSEKKYSTFQRASSVFGFCILVQACSLIFSFVTKYVIILHDNSRVDSLLFISDNIIFAINSLVLFIISFVGLYSILLLITLTESIFALSQASHFFEITRQLPSKANSVKLEEKPDQNDEV